MNTYSLQKGSALIYILIAIALLALLTVTFMEPSGQQTQSQNSFKSIADLESQIEFIRSSVQECTLLYPAGDITIDNTGSGTDEGAIKNYPIKPNSTHLLLASRAANRNVEFLRCPGNPGDSNAHVAMFSGNTGKYLAQPPALFGAWQWYNGVDGVFFWIETDKSDAYLKTALDKLETLYGACEADVLTGPVDLDSDGDTECPSGSYCFRLFMVRKATAVPACP
jgi:hypothetical protein